MRKQCSQRCLRSRSLFPSTSTCFLATVMVVLAHFDYFGAIPKGAWGVAAEMGREAVIVFFVLSGFVIASTVAQWRPSARGYAVARLSRLYSVALPVLLLGLACAFAVRAFTGQLPPQGYALDKLYVYLPFHLLFLGQHWTLSEVPPYMEPTGRSTTKPGTTCCSDWPATCAGIAAS